MILRNGLEGHVCLAVGDAEQLGGRDGRGGDLPRLPLRAPAGCEGGRAAALRQRARGRLAGDKHGKL